MNTRTRRDICTSYQVIGPTLVIRLGGRKRVLSSAPLGGGVGLASNIVNHQVETNGSIKAYYPTPARYLRRLALRLRLNGKTIGLMTAVPMTQLVTARVAAEGVWVECFGTVGVTNAVRAGEWPSQRSHHDKLGKPGTINLILVTNGSLSHAAMVGVVQVATEAKTGVLRDHAVPSCHDGSAATGTGTDAVVIACQRRGQGPSHIYSGTHTIIGALVGRVVTDCMTRGLAKAKAWRESHQ
ncbi:MAG: adenosylcobinamide amidohydrolase [Nitrospira sp.]|nr:adenosylcobinamide amidohydrolase [Nitrospira sp.]